MVQYFTGFTTIQNFRAFLQRFARKKRAGTSNLDKIDISLYDRGILHEHELKPTDKPHSIFITDEMFDNKKS